MLKIGISLNVRTHLIGESMIDATVINEMKDAGFYVKAIESDPVCMQIWKSRWIYILNHDPERDIFTAFRININKIGKLESNSRGRREHRNYIDLSSGVLSISPTVHHRSGLTSIARCLEVAKKTRDIDAIIRISIITNEDDGVVHGFDLGCFKVSDIDQGNFLILKPFSDANDQIVDQSIEQGELMGHKIQYNGRCFESLGEARFAALLDRLCVPFQYEKRSQEIRLSNGLLEAKRYRVDFTLWPDEFRKKCYVEWKRYHPTLEEQEKMATLVKLKGTVGYIAWGEEFKQSIKWTARGKEDRTDTRGIRLMKFIPAVNNNGVADVRRIEGYYLACNDRAIGREWTVCEDYPSEEMNYPFDVKMLRKHLMQSEKEKISKKKWMKMKIAGRVQKDTRVCTFSNGETQVFKPKDVSTLMFKRNPMHEDCTSEAILNALSYAETYVFERQL